MVKIWTLDRKRKNEKQNIYKGYVEGLKIVKLGVTMQSFLFTVSNTWLSEKSADQSNYFYGHFPFYFLIIRNVYIYCSPVHMQFPFSILEFVTG